MTVNAIMHRIDAPLFSTMPTILSMDLAYTSFHGSPVHFSDHLILSNSLFLDFRNTFCSEFHRLLYFFSGPTLVFLLHFPTFRLSFALWKFYPFSFALCTTFQLFSFALFNFSSNFGLNSPKEDDGSDIFSIEWTVPLGVIDCMCRLNDRGCGWCGRWWHFGAHL